MARIAPLRSSLLVVLLLAFTQPAIAQTAVDAKTQEELQGLADSILHTAEGFAGDSAWKPVIEGKTLIENTGKYYAVTLPHLGFRATGNARAEVGIIAVNATRGSTAGQWNITVALPTPITTTDSQGRPETSIDLGTQNFSGVYNSGDGTFPEVNARYRNAHLDHKPLGLTADFGSLLVTGKFSRDGKSIWGGKTGDSGQYSPKALAAFGKRIAALTGETGNGDPFEGIVTLVAEMVNGASPGTGVNTSLDSIELNLPASGAEPARAVQLHTLRSAINAAGSGNGNANAELSTSYDGLTITPVTSQTAKSVPSRLDVNLAMSRVPVDAIAKSGMLTNGRDNGETLKRLLSDAGTKIDVTDSVIGNDSYNVTVEGTQTANLQSPLGMVGKGRVEISGIEALTSAVSQQLKRTDLSPDIRPYMNDVMIGLTMMQLTGQQGTDKLGKPSRIYQVETMADGRTIVNGTDINALLQLVPR